MEIFHDSFDSVVCLNVDIGLRILFPTKSKLILPCLKLFTHFRICKPIANSYSLLCWRRQLRKIVDEMSRKPISEVINGDCSEFQTYIAHHNSLRFHLFARTVNIIEILLILDFY